MGALYKAKVFSFYASTLKLLEHVQRLTRANRRNYSISECHGFTFQCPRSLELQTRAINALVCTDSWDHLFAGNLSACAPFVTLNIAEIIFRSFPHLLDLAAADLHDDLLLSLSSVRTCRPSRWYHLHQGG